MTKNVLRFHVIRFPTGVSFTNEFMIKRSLLFKQNAEYHF